jgi:LmbE family N-acetylglucosaminyl deacetylase
VSFRVSLFLPVVAMALVGAPLASAQPASGEKLSIIMFGAHPDDCDIRSAGTAAKWVAAGHKVRFVAVTNGDAGHHEMGGGILAARRRAEAQEVGRRLGIEYVVLDNHDGELVPSLDVREQIIAQIRQVNADLVLGPRPNDYHPDHRYTGVLLQDAAFMVTVPNILTHVKALTKNPVFLYYQDGFQKPNPFSPDIAVDITDTYEKKIDALDAHVSQFYEWLPWHSGRLDQVPKDVKARREWLKKDRSSNISPTVRTALEKYYGKEGAAKVQHAEAFEICEYGRRPTADDIKRLFPFLP